MRSSEASTRQVVDRYAASLVAGVPETAADLFTSYFAEPFEAPKWRAPYRYTGAR